MKYKILSSDDRAELEELVEEALGEGYELAGGVCVQNYSWENERKGYSEYSQIWTQSVLKRC
jgi:hypothetical protein